jgi:hypothetical protein
VGNGIDGRPDYTGHHHLAERTTMLIDDTVSDAGWAGNAKADIGALVEIGFEAVAPFAVP